jgi:RimJ/RimL family protein N-acetyltransferase
VTLTIREARADHFDRLLADEAPEPGVTLPPSRIAPPEVLAMLADLAASIRPAFSPAAWMILDGDRLVGLCSLNKIPEEGVLTIGYGVAPSEQGRGAASGAIAVLLEWSRSDPRVSAVVAESNKANIPSQRVLERNGFTVTGERVDEEDGDLLCWAVDCSGTPGQS